MQTIQPTQPLPEPAKAGAGTPKEQARHLYFNSNKTQKEIADEVGVSDRTIRLWIKEQSWDKLRQRALQMPAVISDNLCTQLINLQNKIQSRDEPIPTMEEVSITHKLVLCLMKLKNYPASGALMQFMQQFIDLTNDGNRDFTTELTHKANELFHKKETNSLTPLDFEYGIMPSYLTSPAEPGRACPNDAQPGAADAEKNASSKPEIENSFIADIDENQPFNPNNAPNTSFPHAEKTGNSLCHPEHSEEHTQSTIKYPPPNQRPGIRLNGQYLDYLGNGYVHDYYLNKARRITTTEWDAFLNWPYTREQMGNYNFISDPAYDEQHRQLYEECKKQDEEYRQKMERIKEEMKRDYYRNR
jgi:transposase-like protein